jgi:hypothetical protein
MEYLVKTNDGGLTWFVSNIYFSPLNAIAFNGSKGAMMVMMVLLD